MRPPTPDAALSTSVIEPGTRLAGRYRLDDRVSEAGGSTFWKATDEILARAVAVLTFAPGFPRVNDVVTAARAASRLTDPRLTQVFDADDSGERAYVVSEWVTGETLEDLLAQGPMEADRAAAFLLEAAEALTSAHAAGLAHLCLTPHNLVWTSGGTVKITGLGVEAVLSGAESDTPALDDVQGLGAMLYAALTGHWPGGEGTVLPPAPTGADGRPLLPSQVRAGIPHNLDAIVGRALGIAVRGAPERFDSPGAFADALAKVPRSPLPFVPLVGSTPPAVMPRPDSNPDGTARMSAAASQPIPPVQTIPDSARMRPPQPPQPPQHSTVGMRSSGGGNTRGSSNRPLLVAVVVVVLVVVAVGGWALSQMGGGDGTKNAKGGTQSSTSASPTPKVAELKVDRVLLDNDPPHADTTAPKDLGNAIDKSKSSFWTTQHYYGADFGGQRKGIGLVLDMGKTVTVDKVAVSMPDGTPGRVELRVGDSQKSSASQTQDTGDAVGTFELKGKQAKGQYITLWFSKLPSIGSFQIKVKDVTVYGTA
ncbi:protein kinase family protein [Actinoallomurus rhizosphaericola]|uniref:protein kinase family protein n=1 Tax=Actinoallomurus rhizosphaericola TaxID=2952536 RepID=UPI0020921FAF|nr:protein kinase family protein [Actinoallomurus rhizosphaericola]MCO5995103.1 protein kinase family protein [Actinoallomurus rhizosphaericola]